MADWSTERLADLPAGFDDEDPYESEDIDALPEWWKRNIEEFRAHGMRPYRPPKLADGTLLPELVDNLEAEHDVSIRIQAVNPQQNSRWTVWVGDCRAGTVERHRNSEGRTVYEVTADRFESMIATADE
jgi:hypothetical protein